MQSLPSIEIIAISLKLIVFALNHDSHCKDMFILKAFTCSGWGGGGGGGGGAREWGVLRANRPPLSGFPL